MVAYEFYWLDRRGGYQIIGGLPQRRIFLAVGFLLMEPRIHKGEKKK